jgi:hypothetical protein
LTNTLVSQLLQKNPYAAPQTSFEHQAPASTCSRQGKTLIVPAGAQLPHRCVKCNAPAELELRKFSWHHPAWYLTILIGVVVYAVLATFIQKRTQIEIGLCARHRARRRNWRIAAVVILLGSVASLFSGLGREVDGQAFVVLGAMGIFAAMVAAIIAGRNLSPSRIDESGAALAGCGPAFLASLPESR